MLDRYDPENSDSMDEALDELLCEYVDGTMDDSVRSAFEEVLDANPDLAAHVRCLCETREMLCSYGCRHTSQSMQAQIRRRVASELIRKSRTEEMLANRLGNVALLTSAVGLVLILGMMAGVTVVKQARFDGTQIAVQDMDDIQRSVSPVDGYSQLEQRNRPLVWRPISGYMFGAPSSALPMLHTSGMMTPIDWPNHDALRAGRFMTVSSP